MGLISRRALAYDRLGLIVRVSQAAFSRKYTDGRAFLSEVSGRLNRIEKPLRP